MREKKFSVRVGSYSDGNYIRNNAELVITTTGHKVVNAVVSKPLQGYVKTMPNTFDGVEGTYSDMFISPVVKYGITKAECITKINMYPFCISASLSKSESFDEIKYLTFKGEGTENQPFEIGSAYELKALAHFVNNGYKYGSLKYNEASYKVTADIDLDRADFETIGVFSEDGSTAFRGHFDGNGHYIGNLYIKTTTPYTGLFGIVKGTETDSGIKKAVIENITLYSAEISDADQYNKGDIRGILAGQTEYATIRGCVAMGDVSGGTHIGGLIGYAYHTEIINSGANVTVSAIHQFAYSGGIAGRAEYSDFINCYTLINPLIYGELSDSYVSIGLIAGERNDVTYEHCFHANNYANFSDYAFTDMNIRYGLSGEYSDIVMTTSTFLDVLFEYSSEKNLETVFTHSKYGMGIPVACCDENAEYIAECVNTSSGSCEFLGTVRDRKKIAPGTEVNVTGYSYNDYIQGITIKDFSGKVLDIDYTMNLDIVTFIMPECSIRIYPSFTKKYLEGDGTQADPYLIKTYDDLVYMAEMVNTSAPYEKFRDGYYLVVNDIDCGYKKIPIIGYANGDKSYEHAFTGTFDGNGKKIHSARIYTNSEYAGIFYALEGAEIRDIYFEDLHFDIPDSFTHTYKPSFIAVNVIDSEQPTKFVNISIDNIYIKSPREVNDIPSGLFSVIANNVDSDTEFINILIKDIMLSSYIRDNIKNKAFLCSVTDPWVKITMKNILVLYQNSDFDMFSVETPSNIKESENVYHSYVITDIDDFVQRSYTEYIAKTLAVKIDFAESLNDYSKANLMDYEPAVWSSIDNETDIILGISDDILFDYNIIYDEIFTTSETELIDIEYAPVKGTADKEIEIIYFSDADVSNLSIKTVSGADVPFATDLAYQESQFGVIRFIMPWEDVIVSNNGKEIAPLLMDGIGTEEDPYVMICREHLVLVANVINGFSVQYKPSEEYVDYDKAYYIIEKDIDMTGITWDGIGTSDVYFSGQIDGQGNYIKYLNKNSIRPDGKKAGLFTRLETSAVIKNLKLHEAYVYIKDTYHNAAGAFAMLNYGRIEKCMLFDLSMKNDGLVNAGGFAGRNLGTGIIENCAVINSSVTDAQTGKSGSYISYFNQSSIGNCFIYDCVWNSTACDIGVEGGIKPERIYYNMQEAAADTDSYTVYKSNESFASGEVTYLLNNAYALKENVWRQNLIGSEPVDKYPMLETTHRVVDKTDAGYFNRTDIQSTRYAMVGDINVDGLVRIDDLRTLFRFFEKSTAIKLRGMIAADLNADGILDKNDYDILENYIRTGEGKDEYSIGSQLPIVYRMPVNALFVADMNGDFEVNEEDLRLHKENLAIADTLDDDMRLKLDINFDGKLNEIDTQSIELYLEAAAEQRSYGGFPGKVGYIGEEINFDETPVIPEEPEEDNKDDITPPEEDDGICDDCGKKHDNFIFKVFCFFTQFFVTLFTILGIW